MKLSFSVPGTPRGKGRPRFTIINGHVSTYTPRETRDYEEYVRECFLLQCGQKTLTGPVSVCITACFEPPRSVSKKIRQGMLRGEIPHTRKPDLDNIGKAVLDALNKIAYKDDSQITKLKITKQYSETPEIKVEIEG